MIRLKQSGLGDNFYVGGYDLSGDTASLDGISGGPAVIEVTGINKSAYERIGGLRDGHVEWTSHYNPSAGQEHVALSSLPTADQQVMYFRGTTLGNAAAALVGKQLNYDMTRADDGKLTLKVNVDGNGFGLEWGNNLTAGLRTDTAATNGTGVQFAQTNENYTSIPGTAGNYVSTPDAGSLDIVGDIDVRARVAPSTWTPASQQYVLAKWTTTANQRSYALILDTTGVLILQWSVDGTAVTSKSSTANLSSLAANATKWIRATLDVDNGATGNTVVFYTSDDGSTWTQLGNSVVTAGVTSIFSSSAPLEIGSHTGGTAGNFNGKFFRGSVLSGISGTPVAQPISSASSNAVTDTTPLTWTVNGTAAVTAYNPYGAQAYLQVFSFTGTDVTVKIQDSADNATFADVAGLAFTQVTTAPGAQRISVSNTTTIRRYVRAATTTTGGFTSATFTVILVANETANTVF